ncbi:MAG: LamG-like jellyroll fold domain-containing protein [Bacteroidota bacterium]
MRNFKTYNLLCTLIITVFFATLMSSCTKDEGNNNGDSYYAVYLNEDDEDYIDFGTFEGFTAGTDWSIIEKVKMPAGADNDGGWHFFRGKAWEDLEGDIAIRISETRISTWCMKNGWVSVRYDGTFNPDQWYTICLQYSSTAQELELYVDGSLVGQESMAPMDDSNNNNNMFWGGQESDPLNDVGELYSESSIIIAHQAWLQRTLSTSEISGYDGYIAPEAALFFATDIDADSVSDISGNGHSGTEGNTPEYITVQE